MLLTRISFCLMLAAAAACTQDLDGLMRQAIAAQQSGNDVLAVDAYRAFLRQQPNEVAARVNLGVVLAKLGRFDEAISEYAAADKLLPGDPRIALNTALAYQKSGRIREAASRLESLHSAVPENEQVSMLLADCTLQLGDNKRVIELLRPLKEKRSDDLGVDYMLGMALLRNGQIPESQAYLDRILKNGDTAESRFLLGTRMFESGDLAKAVQQFASASELNPKLPGLQSGYGAALLNTGDPDGALAAFGRELSANPGDYNANLMSGQILTVRKRAEQAIPLLQRAVLARPESVPAKLALAQALSAGSHPAEAKPYAATAVKLMPESAEAHRTLAEIDKELGLTSEADDEKKKADSLVKEVKSAGPALHELAPAFELKNAVSGVPVRLSDFRGKSPVVLVFGSYSCPNFRTAAHSLTDLQHRYGSQAPFLLIYIREAHTGDTWQSTRNAREKVDIAPAANLSEKQQHATLCSRQLHLNFPALVDGMDGIVERAYNAWPSRAFVIDRNGRVTYSSALTELDFHPEEMESALRALTTTPTGDPGPRYSGN
jgi:tetratricopeptide (TPR) repeat protein